jgi:hypothetical protein
MAETDYATPIAECDLVMKGGITSGIVYPPAILELAPQFRFRNIGGASAGAIAAVITAAAEYGRESPKSGAGFAGMEVLQAWLSTDTHLFNLFQPTAATGPLYHTLLGLNAALSKTEIQRKKRARGNQKRSPRRQGWLRLLLQLIPGVLFRTQRLTFLTGALVGAVASGALALAVASGVRLSQLVGEVGVALVVASVATIGALLVGSVTCLMRLVKLAREELPRNKFGICTGRPTGDPAGAPALTDWLFQQTQALGGRGPDEGPLTVGQLAGKRGPEGKDWSINLRMITTNLSHAQPYALPFEDDLFLFREDEMRSLFPDAVVNHLVRCASKLDRVDLTGL